jgi:serpin B
VKRNLLVGLVLTAAGLLFLPLITFAQDDTATVVNSNNEFAFDIYSRYKSNDGNIFFSPYSIFSAIAMTYEGARGKAAEEIKAVFHFPEEVSVLRQSSLEIYRQINKKDKKYKLSTANALWAQKDYKFLDDYFNLISRYYGGKATNLDFNQAEKSCLTINRWVEEETNNKIRDLILPNMINEYTRLVLTNAIYFKGYWLEQFDKKVTKEEDFKVSLDDRIKVQMMFLAGRFNYAETDKLQILELPYEGEELSMMIILPKGDDLETVEESLNPDEFTGLKNLIRRQEVDVFLPKFNFKTKYFMAEDLGNMGMPTAFTPGIDSGLGKADFSGMTGNKELNISQMIHQAFVEVNEEGSEAAAATAVLTGATGSAYHMPLRKIFRADHPFIFIIQEKGTGIILFIGRVSKPAVN